MTKFNAAQRKRLAASGAAESDGSYPIRNATDLRNAINDCNRTGQQPADKAHIVSRARALGLTSMLPANWTTQGKMAQVVAKKKAARSGANR